MDITYRVTRQGKLVAYGPASEIIKGRQVTVKLPGSPLSERRWIESAGQPFAADGTEMAYGYLVPSAVRGADEAIIAKLRKAAPAPARKPTPARQRWTREDEDHLHEDMGDVSHFFRDR